MLTQMITIDGPNRTALLSEVSRCLIDHEMVVGELFFRICDDRATLNITGEVPGEETAYALGDKLAEELADALRALPSLNGADIEVGLFIIIPPRRRQVVFTHRFDIEGVACLSLLSQITDLLHGFDARIVRLSAHFIPRKPDGHHYIVRLSTDIPPGQETQCIEAITAAARVLDMTCAWSSPGG